ncbi:endonuclease/exonuclease/phosphatase family protein [Vallicoccus soli]|uniref:Endonuclease/exonuclease/phosphatase family protein n=1 Tax=Vallicoccus soli TaxID=2339232 RepID=A0A3A3Z9P1_9ACTN|nr:endonuclease/exonuclease/phosphatase family protein [Vallicoccus soli]RJK97806.1 endonuclease/exonuclease/phosphatase family protein [Vallicoccus soli]
MLRGGLWAAVAAAALVSLLRLDGSAPLPQVVAFVPLLAPGLLLVLLAAGLLRARPLAAAAAALLLLQVAWAAPQVAPHPAPPRGAADLTVMTANVEVGRADPDAVVAAVRDHAVDVLVLVELTTGLADRLDAAGLARELPERVVEAREGAAGAAVYARTPLRPAGLVGGTTFPAPVAALELPGRAPLLVAAVHPVSPRPETEGAWRGDLRRLAAWSRGAGERVVVAGDLNATRDHGPFRALLGTGLVDAAEGGPGALVRPTWPADLGVPPLVRIDHVLVREGAAVPTGSRTVALPGTDHRAVVAGLAVR